MPLEATLRDVVLSLGLPGFHQTAGIRMVEKGIGTLFQVPLCSQQWLPSATHEDVAKMEAFLSSTNFPFFKGDFMLCPGTELASLALHLLYFM